MSYKSQPHDLHEWLAIATRKLSSSAQQRIRMEIEGHFAEAVAKHKDAGLSESGALAMALEELGDARAAGRHFRKRYLLLWESKHLDYLLDSNRMKFMLPFCYAIFAAMAAAGISAIQSSILKASFLGVSARSELLKQSCMLLFSTLVLVLLPTASYWLSNRADSKKKHARWIILFESCGGLYPFVLFEAIYFVGTQHGTLRWGCLLLSGISVLIMGIIGLRISDKLRRA